MGMRAQRFFADEDLVELGLVGQARGHVGHRPQHIVASEFQPAFDQQHQPGMDAGVRRQRTARQPSWVDREPAHRGMQLECGFGGTAAIVLARLRLAEQRQDAVALHAHDQAAVAGDDFAPQRTQALQHLAIDLGVEVVAECRRSAQVDEHHGHVATPLARGRGLAESWNCAHASRSKIAPVTPKCSVGCDTRGRRRISATLRAVERLRHSVQNQRSAGQNSKERGLSPR